MGRASIASSWGWASIASSRARTGVREHQPRSPIQIVQRSGESKRTMVTSCRRCDEKDRSTNGERRDYMRRRRGGSNRWRDAWFRLYSPCASRPRRSIMKIAVTGATGLIGAALGERLRQEGNDVLVISRQKKRASPFLVLHWNPERGELDTRSLEGVDAVVHLAGETIAA